MKKTYSIVITIGSILLGIHSCEIEKPEVPEGRTNNLRDYYMSVPEVVKIHDFSVKVMCCDLLCETIDGVTARGFCWSTEDSPTINDNRINLEEGVDEGLIEGLSRDSVYSIRAYASNGEDVVYGVPLRFNWMKWQKTFGGEEGDRAHSVCATPDDGCVVAGFCSSPSIPGHHGGKDFYVIKLNDMGDIEWEKAYGGSGDDEAFVIKPVGEGEGYIVVGYTYSADGDLAGDRSDDGTSDFWVVKLDKDGDMEWDKTYGEPDIMDKAKALEIKEDAIIVGGVGGEYQDFSIYKLNHDGEEIWSSVKYYGGTDGEDCILSLVSTNDGGYLAVGYARSTDYRADAFGLSDAWIVKIDQNGVKDWEFSYGGGFDEWARSVIELPDGNCLVGLNAHPNNFQKNVILLKVDPSDGTHNELVNYNCPGYQEPRSVIVTHDDNLMVAGYSKEESISLELWIYKVSMDGTTKWDKNFGGAGQDEARGIIRTTNDDYIVAGQTNSDNRDVTDARGNWDVWVIRF